MKAKKMIKQMAKKGDIRTCKILAKELVRSRRQKDRIVTSKAQLNSISMQLQHQLGKLVFLSLGPLFDVWWMHLAFSVVTSTKEFLSVADPFFFSSL